MKKGEGAWKGVRKSLGSMSGEDGKSSIAKTVKMLMADNADNDDAEQFEAFVQNQVNQQGFELTEEEEKMVQEAIERTLIENKDSGVDLDDDSGASDDEDDEETNEVFE